MRGNNRASPAVGNHLLMIISSGEDNQIGNCAGNAWAQMRGSGMPARGSRGTVYGLLDSACAAFALKLG